MLRSFVLGELVAGTGEGVALVNPQTEELLARASTTGLDFARILEFGRTRGGAALRSMSFAQRGELLATMSKVLHAEREALLDLAMANGGNTRGDAKFDIDGALGTLAYYAKLGADLGDRRWLTDGEAVQLGRTPRFVGRHLWAPRRGVAVHINAFNFPAWGLFEKAATALLAGMPVVTKPATSTALVAARMVELLVAANAVPEGVLQLIAGPAGELLDHVDWQDVIAFTGSAQTGLTIRRHARVLERGVRVNVEADSLNAAVLGPDVEPGSETYELFLREVVTDVSQKAGQKCTAIRRVFVPRARLESVRADLIERVREVKTGDVALREVKVGPLATAQQLRDGRDGIELLKQSARLLVGDGSRGTLTGIAHDKGYFMSPTVLTADDAARATHVHEHEVFGPVSTVLPYDGSTAQAAAYVGLGRGTLVTSTYSDDTAFATELALELAPLSGRVNVGSAKVAEHSMGPGTVLPSLTHGGPGRAGGGEELGGTRGMALYQQRAAIQGYAPLLDRLG